MIEELEAGDRPEQLDLVEHDVVDLDVDATDVEGLDPGETAALFLAIEQDAVLLTDDLDAREQAIERGVEAHGSIGIIALGYARGELDRDEAASLIQALQHETSLFVTDSVVERGIELLDER